MNNKPSRKITLKYLLFILAYANKYKNRNAKTRWDIPITSDKNLMKEFGISNNPGYCINQLLSIGAIYCYDDTYYPPTDTSNGKCRNYDITLTFFDDIEEYLPELFKLPDNIINHKNIKSLTNSLIKKANDNKEEEYILESNSLFLKKSSGRPKTNLVYTDYLDDKDYHDIVNELRNSLFKEKLPNNDITVVVDNYDISKINSQEKYIDYISIKTPSEQEKINYPNITNLLKNLRKRNYLSLQRKTSFTRDILEYDGYHFNKNGKMIKNPVYKDISQEEEEYIKRVYTAYICNQTYVQSLAEHIRYLRNLGQDIVCRLNVSTHITKSKVFIKSSARQYNAYCNIKNKPIKNWKYGHRDILLNIDGFDMQYDLHSAVFIVARLLNTGDWYKNPLHNNDIKEEILSKKPIKKSDGSNFNKKDLKALLFRIFFNSTRAQSVNSYTYALLKDKWNAQAGKRKTYEKNVATGKKELRDFLPIISVADYEYLYDTCIEICGNLSKHIGTIFFYESILECMVMEKVLLSGKEIRNTYDCFYYKSSDYSESEFIALVDDVAKKFYIEYVNDNYSLWWDNIDKLKVTTF